MWNIDSIASEFVCCLIYPYFGSIFNNSFHQIPMQYKINFVYYLIAFFHSLFLLGGRGLRSLSPVNGSIAGAKALLAPRSWRLNGHKLYFN